MPTYRVFFAYPTTKETVWNWVESIIRAEAQTALQDAYQHWAASKPCPMPPPLIECRKKVDLRKQEVFEELHDIS